MKILILMRHGKAEPYAETDAQRPLTAAGQEKVRTEAKKLSALGYAPDVLLTSPLLRAVQTAQIAGKVLGVTPQTCQALDGSLSARGLLELAQAQLQKADCVLLVGHNPNLSLAAGLLRQQFTPLEAGTCAVFDLTDPARPRLLRTEKA